jgi:SecD/SecF fusion protein
MQGKGVVKFFLVVMTIVTLVQYLFILPTNRVEKKADDLATAASVDAPEEQQKEVYKQVRAAYLDSMSSEEILKLPLLKNYTYQELKGQQLALGLDLKGGMSVVLQVDLREFIRTLSNNNEDPTLEEALDAASEAQKNAQSDYVTLFANEFRKNEEGKKLAPIFARNEALREEINFDTPDGEVVRVLRQKANETVQLTFQLLKERIDKLGVVQPNVSLDASRDLILVELPGIDNPERARNFLQAAAKLEFWNVYRITDPINPAAQGGTTIMQALAEANQTLSETMGNGDLENQMVYDTIYAKDTLGNDILTEIERIDTTELPFNLNSGPLFDLMQPNTQGLNGLAVMGLTERNRRDRIDTLLARPEVQNLFPRDLEWHWSADPVKNFETGEITNNYELYAIKKDDVEAPLSGDHVTGANADSDPMTNQMVVSLRMDNTGSKIWGQMTTQAAQNNNREIAILLDGEVVSAPRVNEPILGGSSSISGSFSLQEAEDLATILEIGKLPATTRIIQQQTVGPTLGQQNINKSVRALVVGFLLVLGFMILYYGGAGIIAIVALFLNLFFIFGALASLGTVLTLPGIAGIVLTIGMAVDANVIIFERIREELREGKSTLMAISDGFKNSYSAIIDANVTTILTAMVLAYFGLGPIKGFAVVLIIGVLSSLFTAVLVGRLMFDWWTSKGRKISFNTGFSKNAFANLNIDWLGKRKMAYVISGVLLAASIGSFLVRGFELGVDFKGGYSYNVTFAEGTDVQAAELRETLTASFEESVPVVKAVDTDNTYNIVTDYQVDNTDEEAADLVMAALYEGVSNVVGGNNTLDNFSDADGEGTHVTSSSKVGPTIADDIKQSAVYAAIFALLLIFLYIFIRFSKWQYSLGAVAALFHDSIIVLGLFSVFHGVLPINLEIDQAFIAAILTVIGYSINDTVVVFDRIREFMNAYTKKSKEEVINMAINSTVSRTVITSLTTLLVVAILFVFGGTSIKGFALALLIGIIVGTYSSIFVATPVMSDFSGDLKAKPSKGANTGKGFSKAMEKAR